MSGMVSQHYLIANAMHGIEQNHELISQNIANVNTPNYKSKQLVFSDFMDKIKSGDADKEMLGKIPVEFITGLQQRKDGNNVDLDGQVSALKKNALLFQTYSHLLASKMSIARQAMSR